MSENEDETIIQPSVSPDTEIQSALEDAAPSSQKSQQFKLALHGGKSLWIRLAIAAVLLASVVPVYCYLCEYMAGIISVVALCLPWRKVPKTPNESI